MSPLDDELRATFRRRAVPPSAAADRFVAIERRARRMRRHRLAASVAGSAVVVAAVAVAVPVLTPDQARVPITMATRGPVEPFVSAYALDPADPWPYRGDRAVLEGNLLDAARRAWAYRHGVEANQVEMSPLYGEVYEPSAQATLVFLARPSGDGPASWGVVEESPSGPQLVVDHPLENRARVLMAPLPGDEVPRMLIVAAPSVGAIRYAPDGSDFRPLPHLADGVSITPLEGDTAQDRVRVQRPEGVTGPPVFDGPAPDFPR